MLHRNSKQYFKPHSLSFAPILNICSSISAINANTREKDPVMYMSVMEIL